MLLPPLTDISGIRVRPFCFLCVRAITRQGQQVLQLLVLIGSTSVKQRPLGHLATWEDLQLSISAYPALNLVDKIRLDDRGNVGVYGLELVKVSHIYMFVWMSSTPNSSKTYRCISIDM